VIITKAFAVGVSVLSLGIGLRLSDARLRAVPLSPALRPFADGSGQLRTVSTNGELSDTGAFFQSIGTNGRSCVTCHQPGDAWSVSAAHVRERFEADDTDPIFRPNDGAVCDTADVSTHEARRAAYRLLLSKGLVRVSMKVPDRAEFHIDGVDDPYGCATMTELSMYRRPLPSTNLRFLSTVMWDGREMEPGRSMLGNFRSQAHDATMGHAQAAVAPTEAQIDDIVGFELGLFTAQTRDRDAGNLDAEGALGGPEALASQPFAIGVNDPFTTTFDRRVFTLFDAWLRRAATFDATDPGRAAARAAVARGQELFNTLPITLTGVSGLNSPAMPSIQGTCTLCHDTPGAGNHSVSLALNIGISDASRRTPDLPLYRLQCLATGEFVETTDPGRAMVTGKCADIGRVKGPVLRSLAARAPYFHNGSAATLLDVVNFYDERFALHLTAQQKGDLVAFLRTL
jgi:cytochrome c peroxidase